MSSLSERQIEVLIGVAELFNQTGQPVGSSAVADRDGIEVSSATIRNCMAELEERGLLYQPHTSAGRMPTWAGMRYYVDYLVETQRLARQQEVDWRRHLGELSEGDVEQMVRSAGSVVSELSQLTSIVSGPEITQIHLKDVHLTWLSEHRVLVILVTHDGRVFDRVVRLESSIDRDALGRMQNFLSEQVVGLTLHQVRRRVRDMLEEAEVRYREFMWRALEVGREVVELATRSDLFVEGAANMLEATELAGDVERARTVLQRLENQQPVRDVLERICKTAGVQALIGPELGAEWGEGLSLIACGYFHDGRQVGLVGVLGPMRMDYARMIPLVEHTADVLSKELDQLAE